MTSKVQDQQPAIIDPALECPTNLLDFQKMFPDEVSCLKYLEKMRWPNGFSCEKCSELGEPFRIGLFCASVEIRPHKFQALENQETSVEKWFQF